MTQEEKNIIIAEAQKNVNFYYDTPNEPMFFNIRSAYSNTFVVIQNLYQKLTGAFLVIDEDHIVKEANR